MRHLHSANFALLTDPRARKGDYPIGRCSQGCLQYSVVSCRYTWRVFNPECNTFDEDVTLTLSRSLILTPIQLLFFIVN